MRLFVAFAAIHFVVVNATVSDTSCSTPPVGSEYLYEDRAFRAIPGGAHEVVSIHTKWTVSSDGEFRIEVLSNYLRIDSVRANDTTETHIVTVENVPFSLDLTSCRLTLTGDWLSPWSVAKFVYHGDRSLEISPSSQELAYSLKGEVQSIEFVERGSRAYFLELMNRLKTESGKVTTLSPRMEGESIHIAGVVLKRIDRNRLLWNLCREYRAGNLEGYVDRATVSASRDSEWQPLASVEPIVEDASEQEDVGTEGLVLKEVEVSENCCAASQDCACKQDERMADSAKAGDMRSVVSAVLIVIVVCV